MNLKTCQYFVALAEEMNFTKASESLHITQQSLSGSIKRLEEEYGVELFQRKPYLELTPAGETMLFYSKQMLRNESQMMASLADLSAECSGCSWNVKAADPGILSGNLGAIPQRLPKCFSGSSSVLYSENG